MTKPSLTFQKALLLLDRGDPERGEATLREAVSGASAEKDRVTEIGALCALGDLLLELGRSDEAEVFLRRVLSVAPEGDLFSYEQARARELLAQLRE